MSDYVDHANAARAYLDRLPKHVSPDALVGAAKIEAYLAFAAILARHLEAPADRSRPAQ
ncbi:MULTISPECIES: hypothetical protein [Streptomycetaceae]|uniref:hypothetical protein n=1 Tax=Streptomycetaceae TaxID=2062 RepID=UPI001301142F|nr:hypothetical protein [Streptomyces sp. CB02056]